MNIAEDGIAKYVSMNIKSMKYNTKISIGFLEW